MNIVYNSSLSRVSDCGHNVARTCHSLIEFFFCGDHFWSPDALAWRTLQPDYTAVMNPVKAGPSPKKSTQKIK